MQKASHKVSHKVSQKVSQKRAKRLPHAERVERVERVGRVEQVEQVEEVASAGRPGEGSVRLSKSRVQAGHQCALRLWYDRHEPALAEAPDEKTRFVLDRGTRIGELAQQRSPNGKLIAAGHRESAAALTATREALADPSVPALYEAAVEHRGVLARVDVLERVREPARRDGAPALFDLIEVKSGTRAKDVYVRDLAIQLWIARGAGLRVRRAGLLLLDRKYVYDGEHLDLARLFRFEDLTEQADAMHGEIETLVRSLQSMLSREGAPEIEPSDHCYAPYACPYVAHCTAGQELPEHPVSDLPRIQARKVSELLEEGIEEIHEIPAEYPLNSLQARVRECVVEERSYVGRDLRQELEDVVHPVHYLDFEAFMPAVPLFADTHPYDAVPFQYSLHIEEEPPRSEGSPGLRHLEYLHRGRGAPYRQLAKRLVEDLGTRGSICVYTSYEAQTIRTLAAHVRELRGDLLALLDRLWDLHPLIRKHYYHPAFHGSFSIKAITPVLAPALSYAELEIGDGMAAADTFERVRDMPDGPERERVLKNLRDYCGTDTLAMVETRHALREVARADERRDR